MPRHDVGKQTNHQGKWFGEYPEELHERHDRNRKLQEDRHPRPEDVSPISLRPEQVRGNKRADSQYKRNGDIPRYIGSARENRDNT